MYFHYLFVDKMGKFSGHCEFLQVNCGAYQLNGPDH